MIEAVINTLLKDEEIRKDLEYGVRSSVIDALRQLDGTDLAYSISRKIEAEAMERLEPMIEELVKGEAEHIHTLAKSRNR